MPNPWIPRLAWFGALIGVLIALLVFAPARWLAQAIDSTTGGQIQLVNARGTVWNGQADLLFTGGDGSRTQTALPQGVQWQLTPRIVSTGPGLGVTLRAPCCTPQPLRLGLMPGLGTVAVRVEALTSQWPADLLVGLGTPWNTLRIEGQLALQSPGLNLRWDKGRAHLEGSLVLDALDIASRVSTQRPLGSYRIDLQATADGNSANIVLSTLRGALQVQGSGQWVGGRLRFEGFGEAAPDREAALSNLLNIMGRRQGPRSVFKIG